MKGLYLCACLDRHLDYDIIYNDIDSSFNCDLVCDMMSVNLLDYDFVIASPPCNYYSKANYRRDVSEYSLNTRFLLPGILEKLGKLNIPFIVENVRNKPLFLKAGIFDICNKYNIFVYYIGRHTYFTNQFVNLYCKQTVDYVVNKQYHSNSLLNYRQGGSNVHNVIDNWLFYIHNKKR